MSVYRMTVSPLPPPKPDDYDAELLTLQLLVEACSDERFNASKVDLTKFGRLTSWISFQLSLASLKAGEDRDEGFAARLGIASLEVARGIGDWQQYFGNLLDQSQLLIKFEDLDGATQVLLTVVNSLSTAADHARPMAHVTLASIYRMGQRVDDALYHLELGLRYIHSSFTPEQRRLLLEQFLPLYGKVRDLAGLAHCARHIGKPELVDLVLQEVSPEWSRDRAVFLTSRLRALNEHDLADAVFAAWKG
jgi:hypothetical protein